VAIRYRLLDVSDQTGKTFLITGANAGIGFEAAKALAARGARVILGCRDAKKGAEALWRIREHDPLADLVLLDLDLADLDSIRSVGASLADEPAIDVLVNNAGVMATPKLQTVQGFELQFGINHLGHFALTTVLWPWLMKSASPRVVTVSSLTHRLGRIDFDDLGADRRYSGMGRYEMSKLANLAFTFELARRAKRAGLNLKALACHPGASSTELARHHPILNTLFVPMAYVLNSAAEGALPTLRAATDPKAASMDYFGPEGWLELAKGARKVRASRHARDEGLGAKLWSVSESMTACSLLSS